MNAMQFLTLSELCQRLRFTVNIISMTAISKRVAQSNQRLTILTTISNSYCGCSGWARGRLGAEGGRSTWGWVGHYHLQAAALHSRLGLNRSLLSFCLTHSHLQRTHTKSLWIKYLMCLTRFCNPLINRLTNNLCHLRGFITELKTSDQRFKYEIQNKADLMHCAVQRGRFGAAVTQYVLGFDEFGRGFAGRLQGLDGESGVKTRLHVIVAGAALNRAGRGALNLQALGETRVGGVSSTYRFGLNGRLQFLPRSGPLWILRTSQTISRVGIRKGHKLVDEFLAANFLNNILWEYEEAFWVNNVKLCLIPFI